jgi:Mn-dependent DtxR family transcriptional regulator
MEAVPYLEEEEEEEEEDWTETVRLEVVEFILRRYGTLRAQDLAKLLNWKVKDVNQALHNLEHFGKVKRLKLGKTLAWAPMEDRYQALMHY